MAAATRARERDRLRRREKRAAVRRARPHERRFRSETVEDRIYIVQYRDGRAICNCLGYLTAGHCWHSKEVTVNEHEEQEAERESRALVPVKVTPPTALLPTINDFQIMKALATETAQAKGLLPASIQGPAQAFAIMLAGWELGVRPMTALRHVYVVNGRPEPSAQLSLGLVKARDASADMRILERTEKKCHVQLWRSGKLAADITATWDDAERAGLTKNEVWRKYPKQMLQWTAVRTACRLGAPDALNAISSVTALEDAGAVFETADALPPAGPIIDVAAGDYRNEGDELPPATQDGEAVAPHPPAPAPSDSPQPQEAPPDSEAARKARFHLNIALSDTFKLQDERVAWLRERAPEALDEHGNYALQNLSRERAEELKKELAGE